MVNENEIHNLKNRITLIKLAQDKKDPRDYGYEQWVPEGGDTCPMCQWLASLGRVAIGSLPMVWSDDVAVRSMAHSRLGADNGNGGWKVGNDKCLCTALRTYQKSPVNKAALAATSKEDLLQKWYSAYSSKSFSCHCKNH